MQGNATTVLPVPDAPPPGTAAALIAPAAGASPAPFRWLTRSRRVLLLLAAVWVLNIFDLGFTLVETTHGHFTELNPIAAHILDGPEYVLICFKLGLLTFGSVILLTLRTLRLAELGCWMLLATYIYVAVRWYAYYHCLLDGGRNSFVEVLAALS